MQILSVASECAPFVKTGGLADVVGALARAMPGQGARMRVLIPRYRALADLAAGAEQAADLGELHGGPARLLQTTAQGVELLLLEAPHLFDHEGGVYQDAGGRDHPINHLRFSALAMAGARIALGALPGWRPDVVQAHDWQAGLTPSYLVEWGGGPPCVMSVHNIAFQGVYGAHLLGELGLSADRFNPDGYEYWGLISFLKAGLVDAAAITTVSPSYARELMTGEFGMGMEGLLASRAHELHGILNGVDSELWNPETDPQLAQTFSGRSLSRRDANRAALGAAFGLDMSGEGPIFGVASRLTWQKGMDILIAAAPRILERGGRLVVIGSGERDLENGMRWLAEQHPGGVGVRIGFDEEASRLIYGGADAVLAPSRFEPCGLTQLIAMRYGAAPVVARVGGLADTVIDANPAALDAGCATGFQFSPPHQAALEAAIDRCCDLFADQKPWRSMMRRMMSQDLGWTRSAQRYVELFRSLAA